MAKRKVAQSKEASQTQPDPADELLQWVHARLISMECQLHVLAAASHSIDQQMYSSLVPAHLTDAIDEVAMRCHELFDELDGRRHAIALERMSREAAHG